VASWSDYYSVKVVRNEIQIVWDFPTCRAVAMVRDGKKVLEVRSFEISSVGTRSIAYDQRRLPANVTIWRALLKRPDGRAALDEVGILSTGDLDLRYTNARKS
jgi:hypothetical protein